MFSHLIFVFFFSFFLTGQLGFGIPESFPQAPSREKIEEKRWSSNGESSSGYSGRRGSLQLWQFLVALLDDPGSAACIAWTGRGLEFKLVEPEEVFPCPMLHNTPISLGFTFIFCLI